MPPQRMTVPKARTPARGMPTRRATRNRSCYFPRAIAARSRAARRRRAKAGRRLNSPAAVPQSGRGSIPAKAGIGLRFPHHQAVVDTRPEVAWLEAHTENYMGGGSAPAYLDSIRRDHPIALHGVRLSLGSAEALDLAHLERIRHVVERFEPGLVSEHLSWSTVDGFYFA